MEFTGLVHLALGTQALTPGILGILFVLILAFIARQVVLCPYMPGGIGPGTGIGYTSQKNCIVPITEHLEMIRFVIFIATVAAGLYFINLMEYTGIYDFFSLALTGGFFPLCCIACHYRS